MSTFGRYTGRLRGLSAITGERLEYYLPPKAFAALSGGEHYGFCTNTENADRMFRSGAEGRTAKPAGAAEILALTSARGRFEQELARLRARGVQGVVPVCFYPEAGEKGAKGRSLRRAVPIHERFHAEMRRLEHRLGDKVIPTALADKLRKLKGGPEALEMGFRLWGAMTEDKAAEETLARLEELRQSCKRSTEDCEFVKQTLNTEAETWETRSLRRGWLVKMMEKIIDTYGGGLAFAGAAYKTAKRPKVQKSETERFWDQQDDVRFDF